MGRMVKNPRYQVFTFRTDDGMAETIRTAAKGHLSVSEFLREAAIWWAERLKEGTDER